MTSHRPKIAVAFLVHFRRGLVDVIDQRFEVGARDRVDLELSRGGIVEKCLVGHGIGKGLAERGKAIGRHAGRRQKRPPHDLAGEDQLEDLALLIGLGEIHDQRHVRQIGMLRQRHLRQNDDLLARDPVGPCRHHARQRPAAAALNLAAFEREADVIAAGIAGDDLELGAEHGVEHRGELIGVVTGAGRADGERLRQHILEFADAGGSQRDADADLVIGAADPGEFRGVVSRARFAEQRIERGAPAGGANHAAVARRSTVEIIGQPQAAGAFHVLRHDGGIARDVAAEMARDQPGVKVITTADAVADLQIERFSPVEIGRALCGRRRDLQAQQSDGHGRIPRDYNDRVPLHRRSPGSTAAAF